jgi:hypothetical protein
VAGVLGRGVERRMGAWLCRRYAGRRVWLVGGNVP